MASILRIYAAGALILVSSLSAFAKEILPKEDVHDLREGSQAERPSASSPHESPGQESKPEESRPHRNEASDSLDDDPLEPLNRKIFYFNEIVDGVLIDPLVTMYQKGVPDQIQYAISRFLQNLSEPVTFLNDCLQNKGDQALSSFSRFMLNSVFGVFGVFDVAKSMGLEPHRENFNTTLKHWGVPQGPYIVLPILGPSNPRFILGLAVDYYTDPYNYYMRRNDRNNLIYLRTGVRYLVARSDILQDIQNFRDTSIDFYAAMRSFYKQYMDADHVDGKVVYTSPSLEEFMFDDETDEEKDETGEKSE